MEPPASSEMIATDTQQCSITNEAVRNAIRDYLPTIEPRIKELNEYIHRNPELAYHEHKAHDVIVCNLEALGFQVTRHAYGLKTSFEAMSGSGGRIVNFNAEYDALPGLGHACSHNLIATASLTAFLTLSHVLKHFGVEGRVQLLGTPAEEDGGGKIALLEAGAYDRVDASLMMHPMSDSQYLKKGVLGCAGFLSVASHTVQATYHGISAHAGASPWEGINALDALVSAYVNVSMLRQQILPTEKINGAIVEAPKPSSNAIPALTKTEYTARSPTIRGARDLARRIRKSLEAGALATGCNVTIEEKSGYADLRVNEALSRCFSEHIAVEGIEVLRTDDPVSAATDQGNVSYIVPSLHAVIGIPTTDESKNHTAGFAEAAGNAVAYDRIMKSAKAMAMTGWDVLTDGTFYAQVKDHFDWDHNIR